MERILKSRYRIGQKISENPFSVTYHGTFIGTEKPVIVKIYRRGSLNSALIKDMKQKVAELAQIKHSGVARLLEGDYGWQGFYYVREYIDGRTLKDILAKEGKMGADKACAIVDQILAALENAHVRGVLHLALKPSNIFFDKQGTIKLADFVIEGEIKDSVPQKTREIMENARYASPEELEGKPLSPASDIFSLGMVLFEMVTGKPLLAEAGLANNIKKLNATADLQKEAMSQLPNYLGEIIAKALQRDPRMRFASVAEMRESLVRKSLIRLPSKNEEMVKIFESVVTQYGGEGIDQESEFLDDVGRIRLRWSKEKHRSWILAAIVAVTVFLGVLYAFFYGR